MCRKLNTFIISTGIVMVRRGGAGRVRVPELTNSAWIMPVQIDQAASAAAAAAETIKLK